MIPTTLFAQRTKVNLVIGCSGIWWGASQRLLAQQHNTYGQAEACRYFVGFGGEQIPSLAARLIMQSPASDPSSHSISRDGIPNQIWLYVYPSFSAQALSRGHSPWPSQQ